jgi:integrase
MRYGAGSTFRKPNGKWVATWERPRIEGKRRRGTREGATEAEAIRRMRDAQRAEGSNSPSRRSTESVGAFLDRWLADVVTRTRRERTAVGYRAICRDAMWVLGDLQLDDRHLGDRVQSYLHSLDRHPRTVHHYAACLRAAFAYAVRKRLMTHNPAADLDLPAIPVAQRIPLTSAQLRAFLAAEPDPLWITAAWTGMRQGELLGLRWQDVSLDRASLVVRSSLTRLPGPKGVRYVITEPKTERSRRTVPLLPMVVEALRPIRKAYLRKPPPLDQGLVFCTPSGSPLDAAKVSRAFGRALERAGMPRVRFHDLRHGAATLLLEAGVDLATVGAILGHSNIATTVDIYGHLTDTHKRAAVARLMEVGA